MRAFVIAMECEAEAVRPWLKPDDRLTVCGIGKVNAAAATQKAICEGATEIWNAGLCGGFGDDIEVGDVFGVEKAVEYDFDLAELNGTRIGQLNEYDTPYFAMSSVARGNGPRSSFSQSGQETASPFSGAQETASLLPHRILATGDRFNDSETDNALITKELGATLRDMEGAAIAHVCTQNGIPCYSIKCVSDVAGRGSMTGQYEENKQRCLARLSAVMKEIL